jgi:hypothetical protein
MKAKKGASHANLTPALNAIGALLLQELNEIFSVSAIEAMRAHDEIELKPISERTGPFYRHLQPLRKDLVSLLAGSYRRYFKLALAHPEQTGGDSHNWAWDQLQPAVGTILEWIRDWYMLACDGPRQSIPLDAPSVPPPKPWRAPTWLFEVSLAFVGIGPLKKKNVPPNDSEERLGAAHTRLPLKGARRVFLWELARAFERVRNEETAAAGAIPAELVKTQARGPNKRKGWQQKQKLCNAIQKILRDNPSLQGIKFCAALDKRHAPPLFDWVKSKEWQEGFTWKEAWGDSRLKRKIRRVRQEAIKNR